MPVCSSAPWKANRRVSRTCGSASSPHRRTEPVREHGADAGRAARWTAGSLPSRAPSWPRPPTRARSRSVTARCRVVCWRRPGGCLRPVRRAGCSGGREMAPEQLGEQVVARGEVVVRRGRRDSGPGRDRADRQAPRDRPSSSRPVPAASSLSSVSACRELSRGATCWTPDWTLVQSRTGSRLPSRVWSWSDAVSPRHNGHMLLADLVATSAAVAATRSPATAKVAALADLLRRRPARGMRRGPPVELPRRGSLRQRRTGVGHRGLQAPARPGHSRGFAARPRGGRDLHPDRVPGRAGSPDRARGRGHRPVRRATAAEQPWLRGLVTGEVRQGALDSLVQEALAAAAGSRWPPSAGPRCWPARRSRSPAPPSGGAEALAGIGLQVGRPVLPMLASSAPTSPPRWSRRPAAARSRSTRSWTASGSRCTAGARGAGRHPDPGGHHRPAARGRRGGEVAARRRRSSSTGRRWPSATTVGRGRSRRRRHAPRGPSGGAVTPYFFDLLHLDGATCSTPRAPSGWTP